MVANCGDSDAIIGRWNPEDQSISSETLTINDNVSNKLNEDCQRIQKEFGRKTKISNRYLSPNHPVYGFHSLAMTRALGHKFLENYGVSWTPHFRKYQASSQDLVLVVGSDGLFDVVTNEAILSIAAGRNHLERGKFLSPDESSSQLVTLALKNWNTYFKPDVADNTTACVFKLTHIFDDIMNSTHYSMVNTYPHPLNESGELPLSPSPLQVLTPSDPIRPTNTPHSQEDDTSPPSSSPNSSTSSNTSSYSSSNLSQSPTIVDTIPQAALD